MNRDKNSYVLIYAAVMVILAAVLLAGAAIVLRPAQQENANIDKMQQILRALGQSPDKSAVISTYKDLIKKELLVNEEGQVVTSPSTSLRSTGRPSTSSPSMVQVCGTRSGATSLSMPLTTLRSMGLTSATLGKLQVSVLKSPRHTSLPSSRVSTSSVKAPSPVSLSSRMARRSRIRTMSMVSRAVRSPAMV